MTADYLCIAEEASCEEPAGNVQLDNGILGILFFAPLKGKTGLVW